MTIMTKARFEKEFYRAIDSEFRDVICGVRVKEQRYEPGEVDPAYVVVEVAMIINGYIKDLSPTYKARESKPKEELSNPALL